MRALADSLAIPEEFRGQRELPFRIETHAIERRSGESSSYLVSITAKVVLTAHDGHILYREQFQSTQDLSGFIQEDGYAVKRVAREFAQALVSDMLESF